MKHIQIIISLTVVLFVFIASTNGQQTQVKPVAANTGQTDKIAPDAVKMTVPPLPANLGAGTSGKVVQATSSVSATEPSSKPGLVPVVFTAKPASMNNELPVLSVKPVLPSTIEKPGSRNLPADTLKTNAKKPGNSPKVAPLQ